MKKKIRKKIQIGSFLYKPDYIEKLECKYTILHVNGIEFWLQSDQKVLISKIKKRVVSLLNAGDIILLDGEEKKISFIENCDETKKFYDIKKAGKFHGIGCYINKIPDFYISMLSKNLHSFENSHNMTIEEVYSL